MASPVHYFDPQPARAELPAVFASPFDPGTPHPIAQRAAAQLRAMLDAGAGGIDARALDEPGSGKMFGVLVISDPADRIGFLCGFSGMLGGRWDVDGFVPPLFDAVARDRFWPAGQDTLRDHTERLAALDHEPETAATRDARAAIRRRRAEQSRLLMQQVHDGYVIGNAAGEHRALRSLFEPGEPPAGAGDCAGPKLLGHAYRLGLVPHILAEQWWGAPPVSGGRIAGSFYPCCRGKCGPILSHMLQGLSVAPPRVFGGGPIASDQPYIVFEDDWIIVIDKPCDLLSVPGRAASLKDSVLTRLRARYPGSSGPIVAHRLDLDTSGLMLAAKNMDTYVALQRQFALREVEKRYIAWLDGVVVADRGRVELALRVDLDDRPRQIYDPVHGKAAVTEWSVIERTAMRTKVALVPHTGRTHQLRVHAAHSLGIGTPIVGDRLYGREDTRLMLHADRLGFVHPHTGDRIELARPAPF
ncbi:MAG: RluA family pseudouridine synthase [Kofleriaceae bacterium]